MKAGFKTEVFGPVLLQVNQTVRVDFTLSVGATSESIPSGSSGTQLLSTESAEISQVIARKQVAEIPLNGRNWQQLIALSAGVNPGAPRRPARRIRLTSTASAPRPICICWMEFPRRPPPKAAATTSIFHSKRSGSFPCRRERIRRNTGMWREG